MKLLLAYLVTFAFTHLGAQNDASWNDPFTGNIMGVDCQLKGKLTGNEWNAQIDAQGYMYKIAGVVEGQTFQGTLSDPATNGSLPCKGLISGQILTLQLKENLETYDLVFTKTSGNVTTPVTKTNTSLDNRLIGDWRYTYTYVSGQFSFATDYHMSLHADGTMVYQEGRTAGGGPDVGMDSGAGSPTHLQWKTDNQSIYVNGGQGWEFLARYAEHNGSLLLTYDNGSKKIWERL